jgi:CheY-like chemotaxis protein
MKLLALDDSAAFLAVVERAARAGGWEFVPVASWAELGLKLARERPDVVLVDVTVPVIEGVQVVEIARRHWPDLPFVLTSGEPAGALEKRATAAGASAYVTKTDVPRQLVRILDALVGRRGRLPPGAAGAGS